VGPERGPPRLVNTIEELLGRKSSDFGLDNREYSRGIRCPDYAVPSILQTCH
jgi:hypothetical protein